MQGRSLLGVSFTCVSQASPGAALAVGADVVALALGAAKIPSVAASIDGPLTFGQIRGTVAGAPIRIDAARTHGPDGGRTRLTGSYQGPPALLALTAGALLHFI